MSTTCTQPYRVHTTSILAHETSPSIVAESQMCEMWNLWDESASGSGDRFPLVIAVPVRFFCFPCPVGQFDHDQLLESRIKSLFRHRCQPPLFQGQSEIANPSDYARGAIWPGQLGPGEEMTKTHESNQCICCTEGGQPDYVSLF